MKALIVANGVIAEGQVLVSRLREWAPDRVICADAGAALAVALGFTPDVIIGDMDSLADEAGYPGALFIRHPAAKNESDLELAVAWAIEQDASECVLVGALGGRLDMVLANFMLLAHPSFIGARVSIWEGSQSAWLLHPPGGLIDGHTGDTLSLLPLGAAASGITTSGLRYPLRDESLIPGPARGVSNVFLEDTVEVSFKVGCLLVVHTPGRA